MWCLTPTSHVAHDPNPLPAQMPPKFSGRSRECVIEEYCVVLRDLVMHLHHRRSAMALPYLPGGKRTDVHPVFEADRGAEGWGCRLVARLKCSANEYRRREGFACCSMTLRRAQPLPCRLGLGLRRLGGRAVARRRGARRGGGEAQPTLERLT